MIHLHAHSHYSVLDGLGTVDEIIERCKAIKAPAVAITDHGSISVLPDLFKKAKAAGVKPIIGCEFYLTDKAEGEKAERRYHLTVLAKTWAGTQSIIKALTLANTQFYYRPRLTIEQALTAFSECVVMSACTSGILIRDDYADLYDRFKAAYGEDFYLEVMPHAFLDEGANHQAIVNTRALGLWQHKKAKVVATNDAHYVNPDDAYPHEVLLAIQSGKTWDDPKRWRFNCDGLHMRDVEEMVAAFGKNCPYLPLDFVKAAMLTTLEVAQKCNVELPAFPIHLPKVSAEDDNKMFAKLLADGWEAKLAPHGEELDLDVYRKRLVYEIGVINKLKFTRYFLIVQDIIRWAREQGIAVGPGRGSAAGSLVCYLLDITQLDPIVHKLYFERFLNPERLDYPDIDVDFGDDRRQEVFDYIRGKYGHDKTANINTFGVLTVKSAFRDVARVFGVNILTVNALSKLIDDEVSFEKVPELGRFAKSEVGAKVVDLSKKLSGRIRQNGVHAAGIVLSDRPLTEVAVIEHRKDADVINWDMKNCEVFGLIKIDVLGLSTLSIMDMAAKLVKRDLGEDIDFVGIPLDDEKAMDAFSKGDTLGVFQFEGNGLQGLLKGLQAHDFEAITAATALFRPGPLNAGLCEQYLRISKGDEREWYDHELLKPILSDTKGVVVYQEQVMRIFVDLAGFTYPEADKMRKIIGKKLGKDEFEKHRDHFVKGAEAKGIDPRLADGIFTKLVEFAGYGFNRCIAHDEKLFRLSRCDSKSEPLSIGEMYRIKNNLAYAKATGHEALRKKYMRLGYGYALSMNDEGRLVKNKIVDIYPSGVMPVYRLTTEGGVTFKCTMNHSIPTTDGKKLLSDIVPGDAVYVSSGYEHVRFNECFYNKDETPLVNSELGKMGFQERMLGNSVLYNTIREQKIALLGQCEECGGAPSRFELHHVGLDRSKNGYDDLRLLCPSCHKIKHYEAGRTKAFEKGYPTVTDTVAVVEYVGEEECFDVEMTAPNHNFLTGGGLVVCNSHACAYSMISLWTQYLKTHYPLQFMAGSMTYTDKKERLRLLVRECGRLGIEVKQPDINRSTNVFEVDVAENAITAPLNLIKGVGGAAVKAILKAREERCFISMDDFSDRINKRACHKGIVETLTKAGAFESLGIGERDPEQRIKNFAELMPIFSLLPSLTLGGRMMKEEIEAIQGLVIEMDECRAANLPKRNLIPPAFNSKGQIMVVNNPVKHETKHFQSDGSKHFLKTMRGLGFTEGNFYYTSPIKCKHLNYGKADAACQDRCLEFLKREIELVKPKLIICFASSMTGFFTGDPKAQASTLRGQAVYNKTLDTYIVFSPSPQYAYYQEGGQAAFKESMELVRNIFADS
jgi:uracil-DNA glycosylase family 4